MKIKYNLFFCNFYFCFSLASSDCGGRERFCQDHPYGLVAITLMKTKKVTILLHVLSHQVLESSKTLKSFELFAFSFG
jgi:hypothetical protein